jgi:hypothetical protein
MDIYNYHPETGEYLSKGAARRDPMESRRRGADVWLVPAHATVIPPPTAGDNEKAIWRNGGWRLVPDFRGVKVCRIDGSGQVVGYVEMRLGDPIEADMVVGAPPDGRPCPRWQNGHWLDGRTLADAVGDKLAALGCRRYDVETAGISVSGVEVRTDRESQAMLTGAWAMFRQLGAEAPAVQWKGRDGWHSLGQAEIDAIATAVAEHVEACFAAERAHHDAICSLTTIEEVDAYDITVGWPKTL